MKEVLRLWVVYISHPDEIVDIFFLEEKKKSRIIIDKKKKKTEGIKVPSMNE